MCEHLHTSTWQASGAFFSAAVVNICKRVPKVGRWLNGGEPDSSTSVPDRAKKTLNDSAGVDPPAPFRCAHHEAKASRTLRRTEVPPLKTEPPIDGRAAAGCQFAL